MQASTYLYFDGRCEEAFEAYAKALGGRILMMLKYSDAPADQPVSPGTEGRIMHARLAVGSTLLMGSDTPQGMFRPQRGSASP